MNRHIVSTSFLIILIISIVFSGLYSCQNLANINLPNIGIIGNKPHKKQSLITRNYLYNLGLSKPTELLDMRGDQPIKSIHIVHENDTLIKDYMLFNDEGNLLSVKREKYDVEVVNFKYDKQGRLIWIIPNLQQLPILEYDSINILYQGNNPSQMLFVENNNSKCSDDIIFDEDNGKYHFKRLRDGNELYDTYIFVEENLTSEYHKNSRLDNNIDSINYYYNSSNKLIKRTGKFNESTVVNTIYDDRGRPKQNTITLSSSDSIAWTDKYLYRIDDCLPYRIVTSSSLGWSEDIDFDWEKYYLNK